MFVSFRKILILVVVCAVIFAISKSNTPINWTGDDKGKVCKAYIAELFGRPTSIMNHYKTDENGFIYIKYMRQNDQTTWRNVCSIQDSSMIWAGWMDNKNDWGRWREEDRVELHYDKKSDTITFTGSDSGTKRKVHL
jgi:hypothetical protein